MWPFLTCGEGVEELRVPTAAGEAVLIHGIIAIVSLWLTRWGLFHPPAFGEFAIPRVVLILEVRVVRTLECELKKGLHINVAKTSAFSLHVL